MKIVGTKEKGYKKIKTTKKTTKQNKVVSSKDDKGDK